MASMANTASAAPVGGNVVAGTASIDAPAGDPIGVEQVSDSAIIEWQSFDIDNGESFFFNQPLHNGANRKGRIVASGRDATNTQDSLQSSIPRKPMSNQQLKVAIVGLSFGAEFIPIDQRHPNAVMGPICQRTEADLNKVGDAFGIEKRYVKYDDVLADPDVDFVHINSPIPDHAPMSVAALKAGKHVMCTVPMATTIDECREIVRFFRRLAQECGDFLLERVVGIFQPILVFFRREQVERSKDCGGVARFSVEQIIPGQ